ncbi:MAG: hypothetical protein WDW36_009297 [Sanguina aurantia]
MGCFQWRRITEKTKQAIGLHGNEFHPTSNARNDAMISETRKFSLHIKALHRDFLSLERGIEVTLNTTRGVLAAHLPRVFEATKDGAAAPPQEAGLVCEGVDISAICDSNVEMKHKMQDEVLHPLEQWLAAFRTIKAQNARNEKSRFELDSRRREKAVLEDKHDRAHAAHEKLPESKKGPNLRKLEQLDFKYTTLVDQVGRLTTHYVEVELEEYTALLSLIGDTLGLKRYIAEALFLYRYTATSADAFLSSANLVTSQSYTTGAPNRVTERRVSCPGTPVKGEDFESHADFQRKAPPPDWFSESKAMAGSTGVPVKYEEEAPDDGGHANPFEGAEPANHTPNTLTARTHLTQVVLFSNSSCTDTYSTVQLPFDFSGYLPPAANGSVVTALSWATLVATAFLKSPAQQGTNATAAMVESLMQVLYQSQGLNLASLPPSLIASTLQPLSLIVSDNITSAGTVTRNIGLAALAIEVQLASVTVVGAQLLTAYGGSSLQTSAAAVAAALMSDCTSLAAQAGMSVNQRTAAAAAGTLRYSLGGSSSSVAAAHVLSGAAAAMGLVVDANALVKGSGAVAALCQSVQGLLASALAVVVGGASSGAVTVDAVVVFSKVAQVTIQVGAAASQLRSNSAALDTYLADALPNRLSQASVPVAAIMSGLGLAYNATPTLTLGNAVMSGPLRGCTGQSSTAWGSTGGVSLFTSPWGLWSATKGVGTVSLSASSPSATCYDMLTGVPLNMTLTNLSPGSANVTLSPLGLLTTALYSRMAGRTIISVSNQLQSVAYAALGVDLASYDAAVFGSSSQATGNYSLVAPAVVAVQAANTQLTGLFMMAKALFAPSAQQALSLTSLTTAHDAVVSLTALALADHILATPLINFTSTATLNKVFASLQAALMFDSSSLRATQANASEFAPSPPPVPSPGGGRRRRRGVLQAGSHPLDEASQSTDGSVGNSDGGVHSDARYSDGEGSPDGGYLGTNAGRQLLIYTDNPDFASVYQEVSLLLIPINAILEEHKGLANSNTVSIAASPPTAAVLPALNATGMVINMTMIGYLLQVNLYLSLTALVNSNDAVYGNTLISGIQGLIAAFSGARLATLMLASPVNSLVLCALQNSTAFSICTSKFPPPPAAVAAPDNNKIAIIVGVTIGVPALLLAAYLLFRIVRGRRGDDYGHTTTFNTDVSQEMWRNTNGSNMIRPNAAAFDPNATGIAHYPTSSMNSTFPGTKASNLKPANMNNTGTWAPTASLKRPQLQPLRMQYPSAYAQAGNDAVHSVPIQPSSPTTSSLNQTFSPNQTFSLNHTLQGKLHQASSPAYRAVANHSYGKGKDPQSQGYRTSLAGGTLSDQLWNSSQALPASRWGAVNTANASTNLDPTANSSVVGGTPSAHGLSIRTADADLGNVAPPSPKSPMSLSSSLRPSQLPPMAYNTTFNNSMRGGALGLERSLPKTSNDGALQMSSLAAGHSLGAPSSGTSSLAGQQQQHALLRSLG